MANFFQRELRAAALQKLQFFADALINQWRQGIAHAVVFDSFDLHWSTEHAAHGALEEVDLIGFTVEDSLEIHTISEWPVDGESGDTEHAFQFIEQFHRRTRGAVQLVHEGKDGHATATADFEEL